MSLTEAFRQRTAPQLQLGNRFRALPRPAKWLLSALLIAAFYLTPYWPDVPVLGWIINTPGTSFENVLTDQIMMFILVALGLNVVVGFAGLLDLGYVGFYAVGAYTTAVVTSGQFTLPWIAALPLSVIMAMIAGVILGTPTLRLRGDYLAIVTLGFGEIIRITANNSDWLGGPRGISKIARPPSFGPLEFGVLDVRPYWYLGLTAILLVIFILRRLENSRVGRAWSAVREDEDAARAAGIDVLRVKLSGMAISAALTSIGGTLFAMYLRFIDPPTLFTLTDVGVKFALIALIGGVGTIYGAIIGTMVIQSLQTGMVLIGYGDGSYRKIVVGLALVLAVYLDIIYRVKQRFDVPVFAYQVSGEYAMIEAAQAAGIGDRDALVLEKLIAFKRAGCSGVLTYHAAHVARLLNG